MHHTDAKNGLRRTVGVRQPNYLPIAFQCQMAVTPATFLIPNATRPAGRKLESGSWVRRFSFHGNDRQPCAVLPTPAGDGEDDRGEPGEELVRCRWRGDDFEGRDMSISEVLVANTADWIVTAAVLGQK